jgi:hypothetical protein
MSATTHPLHHLSPFASRAARTFGVATAALTLTGAGAYTLSQSPTSGAPPAPLHQTLRLTDRVAPVSAFPGYIVIRRPVQIRAATQWASLELSPNQTADVAALRRLGFVAGVIERFHGRYPLRSEAISVVEQFHSPASAHAQLLRQFARSAKAGSGAAEFAVPGVPGVIAWQFLRPGNRAVNISFSQGRFYYLIRGSLPRSGNPALSRREIVGAAQLNYLLANGCVAPGRTMQRPLTVTHTAPMAFPVH